MKTPSEITKDIHFIDCGANIGQSTSWAIKRYGEKLIRVDCFEPQEENFLELEKLHGKNKLVSLHRQALWITDTKKTFYPQLEGARTGSSLILGKSSTRCDVSVTVDCIDLLKWIMTNCSENNHTILKIDVEGAEFEILPVLLDNKLHESALISEWFVEFHKPKSPNWNDAVIERFKQSVPNWTDWGKTVFEVNDSLTA